MRIEHFAAQPTNVKIRTPAFEMAGQMWSVDVYPNGKDESVGFLGVYLQAEKFEDDEARAIRAQLSISLFWERARKVMHKDEDVLEFGYWGLPDVVRRSDLLKDENLLVSGTLTINISVRVYGSKWFEHQNAFEKGFGKGDVLS